MTYIKQTEKEAGHCWLIAVLNALRSMGHQTPEPGQPEYSHLVGTGRCGFGPAMEPWAIQHALGFKMRGMFPDEDSRFNLPVLVNHWTPKIGFHTSTIIEHRGAFMEVANLEGWHRETLEIVPADSLIMPSSMICGRYKIWVQD